MRIYFAWMMMCTKASKLFAVMRRFVWEIQKQRHLKLCIQFKNRDLAVRVESGLSALQKTEKQSNIDTLFILCLCKTKHLLTSTRNTGRLCHFCSWKDLMGWVFNQTLLKKANDEPSNRSIYLHPQKKVSQRFVHENKQIEVSGESSS